MRLRIARGRLCTFVLVVPQRKMALVEALHGRDGHHRNWSSMTSNGTRWRGREGGGEEQGVGGGCRMWGKKEGAP
jgi:hypothetical protein